MDNGLPLHSQLYHLPGFHEPFSAISHLFGAVLFLFLGLLLLKRGRGSSSRLLFLAVYWVCCVVLLSMSGVYHQMVRGGTAHRVFELLDHAAIFLLIAGTFTPAHGILFRGGWRWGPLLLVWTAAIAGITLKTIYFDHLPEWVGLSLYFALGWVGVVSGILLARLYGFSFIKLLVLGGLAYSVGGIMDFLGWIVIIPGVVHTHEIFHVVVLIGAFCHYLFVWQFANGQIPVLSCVAAEPMAG